MNLELAKRAVACKHWKWMPGMLTTDDFRITAINPDGLPHGEYSQVGPLLWKINAEHMPDLDDPATLGCLLALVRWAWNDQRINTLPTTDVGWAVADGDDDWICTGTTEAEALVGALEAAA
jgi:hypothetical protein